MPREATRTAFNVEGSYTGSCADHISDHRVMVPATVSRRVFGMESSGYGVGTRWSLDTLLYEKGKRGEGAVRRLRGGLGGLFRELAADVYNFLHQQARGVSIEVSSR